MFCILYAVILMMSVFVRPAFAQEASPAPVDPTVLANPPISTPIGVTEQAPAAPAQPTSDLSGQVPIQTATLIEQEEQKSPTKKDNPWFGRYGFAGGGLGVTGATSEYNSLISPTVRLTGGIGGYAYAFYGTLVMEVDFSGAVPFSMSMVAAAGFTIPTRVVQVQVGGRALAGFGVVNSGWVYVRLAAIGAQFVTMITPINWRYGLRFAFDADIGGGPYAAGDYFETRAVGTVGIVW